jgi:aminopeptidase N
MEGRPRAIGLGWPIVPTDLTHAEAIARARLIQVRSYTVTLDLTAEPARVRTEIEFSCAEPGASTFADLDAVEVLRVALNGEPVDPAYLAAGRLRLARLAADNRLVVEAAVGYQHGDRGLVRFTDPADNQQYVLANCFPTFAPSVFCCFDQLDLRADLTLAVTAPAGWRCIASGAVLERPADGSHGLWRFATVPAVKPYDVTLCAGPYVTVPARPAPENASGIELAVRCRPTLAGSSGLTWIADIVDRSIGYYQDLLGVPCPYDKVDIVFVPELGPVAMQLPAVMYVSEPLLQRAADPGDDFVTEVLAHETAHLWFGCLVEGRWWDDDWLAEGMATYLSNRAMPECLGREHAWAEFGMSGKASAYLADSLPSTSPVSSPVASAAAALTSPPALRYSKGASVIRQLAALIGDDAMRAGLRDYLTRFAWSSASLDDIVGCWSKATGRELSGWARQWLQVAGVNMLRPELVAAADGSIGSAAVLQQPPPHGDVLRTHRIAVGFYVGEGPALRRDCLISAEVSGARTELPELIGKPLPAAVVVNETDLTFAKIRFDNASLPVLAGAAFDVGDRLTESVCWNAAWDMVQAAELPAAEFIGLVVNRISGAPAHRAAGAAGAGTGVRRSPPGGEYLLERAIRAADFYAHPASRPELRMRLATATLAAAGRAEPGSRAQRILAAAFADSAETALHLDVLLAWLSGSSLPDGLTLELELRAKILANLAARDLVTDDDLAAYADADPVSGDTQLATYRARRPTNAAKQAAWTAALADGQPPRLALAHANGFWVPGQEPLVGGFRDRYFAAALSVIRQLGGRAAQRLARALYPATLADEATLAATDAELLQTEHADPVRSVLLEQRAILQQVITARSAAAAAAPPHTELKAQSG